MMMTSCQSYKYNGFIDCCKQIYMKEGLRAFFSGGSTVLMQSMTGATILFLYDRMAREIRKLSKKD